MITSESISKWSGLSFKHLILLYSSPPADKKLFLFSTSSSSKVSKQSELKPGDKIWIFFTPSEGNFSNVLSV